MRNLHLIFFSWNFAIFAYMLIFFRIAHLPTEKNNCEWSFWKWWWWSNQLFQIINFMFLWSKVEIVGKMSHIIALFVTQNWQNWQKIFIIIKLNKLWQFETSIFHATIVCNLMIFYYFSLLHYNASTNIYERLSEWSKTMNDNWE